MSFNNPQISLDVNENLPVYLNQHSSPNFGVFFFIIRLSAENIGTFCVVS